MGRVASSGRGRKPVGRSLLVAPFGVFREVLRAPQFRPPRCALRTHCHSLNGAARRNLSLPRGRSRGAAHQYCPPPPTPDLKTWGRTPSSTFYLLKPQSTCSLSLLLDCVASSCLFMKNSQQKTEGSAYCCNEHPEPLSLNS